MNPTKIAPLVIVPAKEDREEGETKSTMSSENNNTKTTNTHFTNQFTCPVVPNVIETYEKSVQQMKDGIARNKYNHHVGDLASRPCCLCERCENWKLDQCAECGRDLGLERLAKEEEKAKEATEEDHAQASLRPHVDRLHCLGISILALLAFAFAHNCFEWPVWQVVRDIIVPATRDLRCRYGDLPEVSHLFSKANVFMSHCWGATFGDLIGAACVGGRMDRVVWIDIFAVRQWPGNVADLDFRGVIKRCTAMIVSVSPVEGLMTDDGFGCARDDFMASKEGAAAKKILAFFRLWCVVEIAAAVDNKKPIVVRGGKLTKRNNKMVEYEVGKGISTMLGNLMFMIDTEKSECAVIADYNREIMAVRELDGGVEYVNKLMQDVVHGAVQAIESNIPEIDGALCGEYESLLNMKIFMLSNEEERSLAQKVLHIAVLGGREEIVHLLLKKWGEIQEEATQVKEVVLDDVDSRKEEEERGGETRKKWLCHLIDDEPEGLSEVIIDANIKGNPEIVRMLLEVKGIAIQNDSWWAGFYFACQYGHLEVVKVHLNAKGFDINKKHWRSPLKIAKEMNHNEIVQLIIAAGAQ